jgi:trk system potassium uptake protein TrkH
MDFVDSLERWVTPIQMLFVGFIILILVGSFLLMLPMSSSDGSETPFVDALFTSTSAVTTTGLVVVDTGAHYSFFGQIVTLVLFQVGGLGYMIFVAFIVLGLRGKLSIHERVLLRESLVRQETVSMITFAKIVILVTFFWEVIGAALLTIYWSYYMPISEAFYAGVYHSVSAFCTAGFGLFSDSMSSYQASSVLNIIINTVCIAGGIGFFVLYDMYAFSMRRRIFGAPWHISIHTKFVLILSALFMIAGTVSLFFLGNSDPSATAGERLLHSSFQAISASSTTGFNTVDIGAMSAPELFIIIILMFIGASPGGTGGGIKTTTFGLMILFLISVLSGRESVNLFKRLISSETLRRVFAIGLVAMVWVVLAITLLTVTEKASFLGIVFEVVSAFGTVGLSMGITPALTASGKLIICISMLIGRIGPLSVGFSLIGKPRPQPFKYAEADILVG